MMDESAPGREVIRQDVREMLKNVEDEAHIRNATHSDDLAKDLAGHVVKIAGSTLSTFQAKVTLANTGKVIPNIRRVELVLDAQKKTITARLYRWKHLEQEKALEYAETDKIQVVTLARVEEEPNGHS